jgi:hypothetical protein
MSVTMEHSNMTQSLWVVRNRDTGEWWNGFGFTQTLQHARIYIQDQWSKWDIEQIPFPVDILELRLIETESVELCASRHDSGDVCVLNAYHDGAHDLGYGD